MMYCPLIIGFGNKFGQMNPIELKFKVQRHVGERDPFGSQANLMS